MTKSALSLTLLTTAASIALSANAYATTYAYYQNQWSIDLPVIQAGMPANTTYDGVKVNALNPVLGNGVTIGDIDTGSTASWVGFKGTTGATGRVIGSFSCLNNNNACLSASLNNDGNGHGTFTMSEMIGGYNSQAYNANGQLVPVVVPGVAPNANAISVQVLNAQGSGSTAGVAAGITFAANQGVNVMNLSLGPFDQSFVSAINAAAAKGVYVVFAGGNSSQAFNTGNTAITGLTNAALQHLVFVGSTDNYGDLSSFSNTPGTGKFVSTTGQSYSYASMWLMAPGENQTGASNLTGQQGSVNCGSYSCLSSGWSGTSMAAPQVTGAIADLISQWPILKTNGAAATILEYQAIWLGGGTTMTNGTTTYSSQTGQGFLDVGAAFLPIGTLTTLNLSGKSIAVSSITSATTLASPALNTTQLTALLSNYTAFDMFQRNFGVNLSALVKTAPAISAAAAKVAAPVTTASAKKFADGSSLAFGSTETDNTMAMASPSNATAQKNWYMSFTDADGSTMAAGEGFPATASFAGALWGTDKSVSSDIASLGVSDSLLNLASGGTFAAYGMQFSGDTRMAFSYSQTANDVRTLTSQLSPEATAFGAGITTEVTKSWLAGVTFNLLNEQNGMLGTTYAADSPVSFGNDHKSMSIGLSSAFALGDKRALILDAAMMRTNGAQMTDGLVSGVSTLYAHSFGAAVTQRDALHDGDNLSLSARAPMRIFSGSANIATASVDSNGYPVLSAQRINLSPNAQEMDFSVGYGAPVSENVSWNMSIDGRQNADNIRGARDADFLVSTRITF